MTDFIDSVVIGAGLIGLAVARRLALAGREVLVLEAQHAIGTGVSSRNSEVIHAGIYYRPGSLKAALCVEGARRLYAYCESHGIPHRRTGKLIVAADDAQIPQLEALQATARANGVGNLVLLDGAQAMRLEPALTAHAALLSPGTGIVDTHALMLAWQGETEDAGGVVAFGAPVLSASVLGATGGDGRIRLNVGGAAPLQLDCRQLVNAAALCAPALARRFAGLPPQTVPADYLCKGSYYQLAGRAPFGRLIYPIPEAAGLGIHLTLDLGGQARFGPDVEWVEREAYDVELARSAGFYAAIRRYWRDLPDGALHPAYAGIRPKIAGPGEAAADFLISGPETHGIAGLVNLFGIESPGLTASLAIADRVFAALG